jgi:hypothetical protein
MALPLLLNWRNIVISLIDRPRNPQQVPPTPANASDAGDSLSGFGLHTTARQQFVIELQM